MLYWHENSDIGFGFLGFFIERVFHEKKVAQSNLASVRIRGMLRDFTYPFCALDVQNRRIGPESCAMDNFSGGSGDFFCHDLPYQSQSNDIRSEGKNQGDIL